MADWRELERALANQISGERLAHTYRVLETARALGSRYGADAQQVSVAALMHDYGKGMKPDQLLAHGRQRGLIVDPAEEAQPELLHGPVAAALLAEQGLVTDPAVLDAIRYHTTGRAGMSLLEKVIWLADYIEPGRRFPGVEAIRAEAEADLNRALLHALDNSIIYVIQRGWALHRYSVEARNWLLQEL
ncbi:MAG: bis(5'-nucleosyl)-tetraphosphatase (symmetrical) YqeK [Bacillota bacterium]